MAVLLQRNRRGINVDQDSLQLRRKTARSGHWNSNLKPRLAEPDRPCLDSDLSHFLYQVHHECEKSSQSDRPQWTGQSPNLQELAPAQSEIILLSVFRGKRGSLQHRLADSLDTKHARHWAPSPSPFP